MVSKKFFAIFLVFALSISLAVGCSNSANNNNNAGNASASPEATATPEPTPEIPAWQTENITLTYASWENKDYLEKMVQAFMDKYKNITVVKDESISGNWTEALTAAASGAKLPDVFRMDNVPVAVQNDWLYDISEFWDADEEAGKVYPNVAKTAVYGTKRLAMPTAQTYFGVFVNKTLLEQYNIPLPGYDWTIEEMMDLAARVSKPAEHIYGFSGPFGNLSFNEWWPMANDASVGFNTFDGEKFHFTNPDWIYGYEKKLEMRQQKIEEKMTEQEKIDKFGDKGAWPLMKGTVAFGIEGAWNIGWLPGEMEKSGAGIVDFYPYPKGKAGNRLPLVLDYIGVASTTKHPEAAYELMKWLSISEEGWMKRIEVMTELGQSFTNFPVSDYPEVWTKIGETIQLPGVKAAFDLMATGVPNYDKWLPGWRDFQRWMDEQGINKALESGEKKPADVAKELEDTVNKMITEAMNNAVR